MKTKLTLVALLISIVAIAQQGINYKAVIKDDLGNVVINQAISIEFAIQKGMPSTNVYTETHAPTTDANGIIIVNIGQGNNVLNGVFNTIDWNSDDHYLNVQIDLGDGNLTDLGTTQFMAVPYALNVSGLGAIDEGNGIGYRIIDLNSYSFYGDIGWDAIDLSINTNIPNGGATGYRSLAMGFNTTASGTNSTAIGSHTKATENASTAMGDFTKAFGDYSTAMGYNTTASGRSSATMGNATTAPSFTETTIGSYNTDYPPNSTVGWNTTDRLFVVGNGSSSGNKSNALTILKNGKIGLGTDTPNALLHLRNAASTNNPQLELTENTANAGTRINFKNAAETTNRWTLFARTDNTHANSEFNIFYSGLSNNIMSFKGDGNVNINSNVDISGNTSIAGNVAIGNITPGHLLDVGGRVRIRRGSAPSAGIWYTDNDGEDSIFSGAFEHGYTTGSGTVADSWGVYMAEDWKFRVRDDGDAFLDGTLYEFSDRRLKKDIINLTYGLDEVLQLQPKQYFWKDRENQKQASIGLIAQDVQEVIANVVHEDTDEKKTLSLSYIELIPVLINAIKEQQDIINNQNKTNTKQASQLEALLSRVETLEANTSN